MVGEQNMGTNQIFQTKTIEALTSGYRINSSGDDAAGLAVANGYASSVAQLTQGIINGNSAASQLQIMDGGLSNISTILDRLQTLATESASSTFTGDRTILNNEYQSLLTEINRQAANIGLNTGGTNATALTTYIGGGNTQGNSEVTVNLANNAVDVTGLGLSGTNLLTAGTDVTTGNAITDLNTAAAVLTGTGATTAESQTFTFQLAGGVSFTATASATSDSGISVTTALQQLNNTLNAHGLTATVDSTTGQLMISGNTAFTMTAGTVSNTGGTFTAGSELATAASAVHTNGSLYSFANQAFTAVDAGDPQNVSFTSGGSTVSFQLTSANAGSLAAAAATLTTQLSSLGIQAVVDGAGSLSLQSSAAFTATVAAASGGKGFTGTLSNSNGLAAAVPSSTGSSTGNSLSAVTAVQNAVTALGSVQGKVGAGENTLQYAISLANSQVANIASAESQIRDADVATEAANLSKAQVLEQASVAAMAQANAAPQAVLKLFQ